MTAQLHFAIHALTLQLLLERAKGLVDIIVANDDLHTPCRLLFVKTIWGHRATRFAVNRRYSGNKKIAAITRRSDEAPTRGIRAEMQAPARRTAPVAPPDRPALARDCARPVACGIGSRTKRIRTRDRQLANQLKRNSKYSEAEWKIGRAHV